MTVRGGDWFLCSLWDLFPTLSSCISLLIHWDETFSSLSCLMIRIVRNESQKHKALFFFPMGAMNASKIYKNKASRSFCSC